MSKETNAALAKKGVPELDRSSDGRMSAIRYRVQGSSHHRLISSSKVKKVLTHLTLQQSELTCIRLARLLYRTLPPPYCRNNSN